MATKVQGDPTGGGQPPDKPSSEEEKRRKKNQKKRDKKKEKKQQQHVETPVQSKATDQPVSSCQWALAVTVVSQDIDCEKDIEVKVTGDGKRSTKDEQPTRMVNLKSAVVEFQGEKTQNLTVTASAPGWRLVASKPVTVNNGTKEEVELVIEPLVRIEIRHEDGEQAAKQYLLVPNTRKFKAVLNPPQEGGEYVWGRPGGVAYSNTAAKEKAEVTGSATQTGDAEIEVHWQRDQLSAKARHKFRIVSVRIRHEDGTSNPKANLLRPNTRNYKAVLEPALDAATFEWPDKGDIYTTAASGATVTVTSTGKAGPTEIQVTGKLDGQEATVKHAFRVVALSVKDADGTSTPKRRVLKEKKRGYKAVTFPPLNEGQFQWSTNSNLSIEKDRDRAAPVEITGASAAEDTPLKVKYTLDGQSDEKDVKVTVIDVTTTPELAGVTVNRKTGASVNISSQGAPDEEGHQWSLGASDFGPTIEGGATKPKVRIKASKPGIVEVKLNYTLDKTDTKDCKSTAFFVDERVKSLRPENKPTKNIAEDAADTDKVVEVLLGIANDPAVWEIGKVDAEAEGKPARLEVTSEDGAHTWTPPANSLVRAAATQPANHGTDQSKLRLQALPRADNSGPPDDPGYFEDEVKVKYTLHSVGATDKFKVKVHRFGCSQIHWQRKRKIGATPVDINDRPVPCTHWSGTKQWSSITNATPPPGGGNIGILGSGGHQHVGRCFVCSGAASEHDSASPRHVWHWIPVTNPVLTKARALASAVRRFALDHTDVDATYAGFLTGTLWNYVRPQEYDASGDAYDGYASKMLGVLRGWSGTGAETWLYALSGFWNATVGWESPISLGANPDTSRTIPSFQGGSTTYNKTQAPFNASAIQESWGKLGRCAATALLGRARALGLRDLEMAEVWLEVRDPMPHAADFRHLWEIGSCEQCRRYLGRMLCEVGT